MNIIGKQIERYRILERLGHGGMAVVYKAYDTRLEREVAFKVIRTEEIPKSQRELLLQRFEREAKSQALFDHPNIVPIFDYGEENQRPFLVMALKTGGTLKDLTGSPMEYHKAAALLAPIASALAYAHQQGVIHRDVKPSNILIDGRPMLTDFGIAKLLETEESTLTGTGLGVGTPEYMAPEQWKGKPVPQTDIYALGVILYELITGKKPYTAETPAAVAILQATEPLKRPIEYIAKLPKEVEQVLFKALALRPEDRYETMQDFYQVLLKLAGNVNEQIVENIISSSPKRIFDENSEEETYDSLSTKDEVKKNKGKWLYGTIPILLIISIVGFFLIYPNYQLYKNIDLLPNQEAVLYFEELNQNQFNKILEAYDDFSKEQKTSLIQTYEVSNSEYSLTFINLAIEDEDTSIQILAAQALGNRKDERSVDLLISMIDTSNYNLQVKVIESLGNIGGEKAKNALIEKLDHSDSFLEVHVKNALKNTGYDLSLLDNQVTTTNTKEQAEVIKGSVVFEDDFDTDMSAWFIPGNHSSINNSRLTVIATGEEKILFKVDAIDYEILLENVQLNYGPGFGVFFRTKSFNSIDGYTFQFDPHHGDGGGFIIRPWENGNEGNPIAEKMSPGFDWYNKTYDVRIVVNGFDFQVFIDDENVLTTKNTLWNEGSEYVGLRFWDSTKFSVDKITVASLDE